MRHESKLHRAFELELVSIQGNDIHFNYEHEEGLSLSYSELDSKD